MEKNFHTHDKKKKSYAWKKIFIRMKKNEMKCTGKS